MWYTSTFEKHVLLIIILALGFANGCVPVQEQQFFDDQGLFDKETRIVQDSCRSEYQSSMVTPNTISALWTYMEILGPDGHTPMCLYGLLEKPTEWKFSPDGRYLYTFTLINHNWAYDVYQLSTGKDICDGRGDGHSSRYGTICPPIKLTDGRWWSGTFPDIVLKSNDPKLWNLVNSSSTFVEPTLSPNGEWMVGKSSVWYVASSDGKVINQFSLPYSYGQTSACGQNPGLIAWRADSRQFAIIQETDKVVFVWSIQDNGNVHQDESLTLEKCTGGLKLSPDGKIITK